MVDYSVLSRGCLRALMAAVKAVGVLWLLPIAIPIWVGYILPFWALGLIKPAGRHGLVIEFHAVMKWSPWKCAWRSWAGHAMPFAIIVRSYIHRHTRSHELRHCQQWMWLGPLFPFIYFWLLIQYGYRGHPMELDAETWAWEQN